MIKPALIILALLVTPQKPGKIETAYDRFKDHTTVETDYMRVAGSDWDSNPLEIAARFSYAGPKPTTPERVTIFFYSASKTWRFQSPPELRAIIDGERLLLGRTVLVDSDIHADRYSVSVREYLALVLPFDIFQKLTAGKSVEMQLGSIEFRLSDKTLATFRELVKKVA